MIPVSLTVPDGAVRGLSSRPGSWVLHVSNPETMGVTHFRLTRAMLKAAKDAYETPDDPRSGTSLLRWLLKCDCVDSEKLDSEGQPVTMLKHAPNRMLSMDRPTPKPSVPAPKPPPAPPVDQNPADKPHLLNHPADRPADLSM